MPHKLAGIDVHKKVESRTGASRRERTSAAGGEKSEAGFGTSQFTSQRHSVNR